MKLKQFVEHFLSRSEKNVRFTEMISKKEVQQLFF